MYMYEHPFARDHFTPRVHASCVSRRNTWVHASKQACIMGSHWNVSFEPVRSVSIGSVHDRMTEVVALGSGGLICCGFARLLVRRRLHRRSYAILMDKGTLKKDVCKCCSNQSRRRNRKTLLFANTKLSTINECEEALPAHHMAAVAQGQPAHYVSRTTAANELWRVRTAAPPCRRGHRSPPQTTRMMMAACPLPGATKSSTTWHKAHRRQVPAEAVRR